MRSCNIKKETIKIKYSIKDYKRIARDLYPIVPTKVHKNKKRYDRKRDKEKWLQEWKNGEYDY